VGNSTSARLLAGLLTIFPLAYTGYLIPRVFALLGATTPSIPQMNAFVHINAIAMIPCYAALGMCLVYLYRSARIPHERQTLWLMLLLFGSVFVLPIFWYIYIRPAKWQSDASDL
jgi:hypothetical protein